MFFPIFLFVSLVPIKSDNLIKIKHTTLHTKICI